MQRNLPSIPALDVESNQAATQVDSALVRSITRDGHHAIFVPLHYEPNYAYPLVVWLHGAGDDESQLRRIMPLVSMRNYVAIAPRGTRAATDADGVARGFTWSAEDEYLDDAEQAVFEAIETATERCHVSPIRVFIAGYDSGGTMALRLAFGQPPQFAGVLSLCGSLPTGGNPLRRLNEARRLPAMVACGRESQLYPPRRACDDLRLFHTAGMDITLRMYPAAQEITPHMLADMDRWMMERVTGIPSSSVHESPPS